MNPIAEEILMHYGMPRRSGRYPWGSGENPYQHSGDFLSRMKHISLMWRELKNLLPRETIFWQKDLVYRWKVIPIISHMKRHFFIKREVIGRCRVLWVLIYHKVMTSVLLHFYFHYQMVLLESKPETTFLHQL